MSFADSDLLSASSILGNDIYKIYIKSSATNDEVMKIIQWTMVLVDILVRELP